MGEGSCGYLRIGSVSLGIGSRQVATVFDIDLELSRLVVVLKTELYFASDGHRAVSAFTGARVHGRHGIAASL